MTAEVPGFKQFVSKQNKLEANSTIKLDGNLQVGQTTETVEVSASAEVLQTESGAVQAEVTGQQIQDQEFNGRSPIYAAQFRGCPKAYSKFWHRRRRRGRLRDNDQPLPFFWQASEEVEDMHARKAPPRSCRDALRAPLEFRRIAGTPGAACFTPNRGLPHHPRDRRHALCGGNYGHQYGSPGGERTEAARRRLRVHLLRLGIFGVGLIGVPVLAFAAGTLFAR